MQLKLEIFRAMLHCHYKAWMLSRQSSQTNQSHFLSESPTSDDKLALSAYQYTEAISEGKEIQVTEKAKKFFMDIRDLVKKKEPPPFYRNAHCRECMFWSDCHQKLIEKDCISLLGMPSKILSKYRDKGIFTVLQLSHLFKLRRRRNRPHTSGNYLYELKALAIREKKTFVLKPPEIEKANVSIFIDFEGLPEEDLI